MNILDFANEHVETAPDLNEAKAGGGGDYTPPVEGACFLRLVGYVEVGAQKQKPYQGKPKPDHPFAWLIFELSGKNYPPKEINGEKVPHRITVKLPIKQDEKATYYKWFKAMNWNQKFKHFSQMLGQPFMGTVSHWKFTPQGADKEVVIAQLASKEAGISVRAPIHTQSNPVDGTTTTTDLTPHIPAAISQLRLFVWNAPLDKIGMLWDNIHIPKVEGQEYDPNVFQKAIVGASNFAGSNIAAYLQSAGITLDVGAPINERPTCADVGLGEAANTAPGQPDPVQQQAVQPAGEAQQASALADLGLA